ncbi:nitronate monooxygenase [Planomonospora sp. ID67723]|uniref:nitronate monooxygenase n=1 Tax=Planomonospora sp. ID67723 TaxID=2738134 RepID=UPI0018C39B22
MALSTAFTKLFGVRHPIALAPMRGSAGGALAAAVSRGGGLGLLGSGKGDRDWLARELPIIARAGKPWGIGFLTWAIDVGAVERALEHNPRAVMLSFGDPSPFAERIRRAGHRAQQRPGYRPRLPVVVELHRPHPRPSVPRPMAGPGSGTCRGSSRSTDLSGRRGTGRGASAAGVGQRGHRPHHRPDPQPILPTLWPYRPSRLSHERGDTDGKTCRERPSGKTAICVDDIVGRRTFPAASPLSVCPAGLPPVRRRTGGRGVTWACGVTRA